MNDFDIAAEAAADSGAPQAPEAIGDRLQRLSALAEQLRLAQINLYEADCAMAEAEKRERQLREVDIPELMKECGMKEFKLANGVKVSVTDELKCGIAEERKAAAFEWLRQHKLGGIIKQALSLEFGKGNDAQVARARSLLNEAGFAPMEVEEVHWQTLRATLKEERAAGRDVPADLFGLFPYQSTRLEFPPGVERPKKPRPKK